MFVDVLPFWERCTYFIVGIGSIAYMIVRLFLEGEELKDDIADELAPGWSWLGRDMYDSDYEWCFWRKNAKRLLTISTIHVILSQICFYFKVGEKLHMCVLLAFDVMIAAACFGIGIILVYTSAALIMYAVSFVGRISLVWLAGLALMCSLSINASLTFQYDLLHIKRYDDIFMFEVGGKLLYLRLISFAMEKVKYRNSIAIQTNTKRQTCKIRQYEHAEGLRSSLAESTNKCVPDTCQQQEKAQHESFEPSSTRNNINLKTLDCDPSLLDLLFYAFYLSIFFNGPIFVYKDFHCQIKASFTSDNFKPDVCDIVKKLLRLAFWAFFIDFQFHFLYYCALCQHKDLVSKLSKWTLAISGYCQGQFFMMKYLVIFGFSLQMGRFDGLTPIAVPRCISWVYSYTDMWKHFDVGLYNFIKTYIYIPLGGSRARLLHRIVSSGLAFLFIYFWHGSQKEILIWCFGNFLMVMLETTAQFLEQSAVGIKLKSILCPAMYLRVKVLLIFPVYLGSCLQVFYFFFGMDAAWIFTSTFFFAATWETLLALCVIVTACIHNAIYISQRYQHRQKEIFDNEQQELKKGK